MKRRASALRRVVRPVKTKFKNRFAKFYWLHRDAFNSRRKRLYVERKHDRACVKCGNKRVGKSIFCPTHLRLSRVYNRRSRNRR